MELLYRLQILSLFLFYRYYSTDQRKVKRPPRETRVQTSECLRVQTNSTASDLQWHPCAVQTIDIRVCTHLTS